MQNTKMRTASFMLLTVERTHLVLTDAERERERNTESNNNMY